MPQVELTIMDSQYQVLGSLDITDNTDFPLAISHSLADLKDITKRTGASSKTFSVPATKNNNKLLSHIYNVNVSSTYLPVRKARVMVNGIAVFTGNLKVKGLTQYQSPEAYELELTGDNLDWVEQLKLLSIRDLDFVSPGQADAHQQVFDAATIEASWNGAYPVWDYVYSLKSYGGWRGNSLDTQFAPRYVLVDDMRPDVYVLAVINRAFAKIGYTFQSNFLSGNLGKKLIIPFVGNNFLREGQIATDASFKVKSGGLQHFYDIQDPGGPGNVTKNYHYLQYDVESPSPDFFDNGNHFTTSYVTNNRQLRSFYTSPSKKIYVSFTASGLIKGINGHVDKLLIEIIDFTNGAVLVSEEHEEIEGINEWEVPFQITSGKDVLAAGHRVGVKVTSWVRHAGLFKSKAVIWAQQLEFYCEVDNVLLEGDKYHIATVFPDWNVLDILAGLNNMFNLYYRTDAVAKTVYCEPREQFYKPVSDSVDWTYKLDISKGIATDFIDSYNRNLVFTFKNDSKDKYVQELAKQLGRTPGARTVVLPERFKAGKQELGTKFFAYTAEAVNEVLHLNKDNGPILPVFWKDSKYPEEAVYDYEPRILLYRGNLFQIGINGNTSWAWKQKSNIQQKIPYASCGLELDYSGVNGLAETYYKTDVAAIKDGRIIIAWFYLKAADMMNIDLRKPVFISHHNLHGYYYINKIIDYQPLKNISTKVELIKIVQAAALPPDTGVQKTANPLLSDPTLGQGTGKTEGLAASTTGRYPATVLNNGSGNWAVKGSASVVMGEGLIATGSQQLVLGKYNVPSENDLFQVGGGSSHQHRYKALSFTKEGQFLVHGGQLYNSEGQEILYVAEKNEKGQPTRFDKLHLRGDQ
ncbi:MAG: hypothetical protein SFW35_00865 [Chitinophagales bacterium]|nr:hypothetical protein [Chitinophagales bacterium]